MSPYLEPRFPRRDRPGATLRVVVCVFTVASLAGPGMAPGAQPENSSPTPVHFGIAACTQCHSKPVDGEPLLCRCDEVTRWEQEDKHRDAFTVLRGERARTMGKQLQLADVSREKSCLSCHSVALGDEKQRHKSFKEEEGVSCVVCHGAYREWVALHGDVLHRDDWRALSRKEKEDRYGMKDLHDPIKRAQLCVSCHLGNSGEGKVVTHAMYAAGHPPLPGMEIATFSDAMPRHWQLAREKKPEVRQLLKPAVDEPFEQTRQVLVGGVIAYRESLRLLADQAAARGDDKEGLAWPERGLFDCYACHHDLKSPGWRLLQDSPGLPGFPRPRTWPTALLKAGLRQLGAKNELLDRERTALERALDARPFGKPGDVQAAANRLAAWSDQLGQRLAAQKLDRAAALKLLDALCALPTEGVLDYDSARQVAWSIEIVYGEVSVPQPPRQEASQMLLSLLRKDLCLRLPSGRKEAIDAQLPDAMRGLNDFDPRAFRRRLAELRSLLPRE